MLTSQLIISDTYKEDSSPIKPIAFWVAIRKKFHMLTTENMT